MTNPKPFKPPPKRFQPKGLTILYEDHDILVVDKVNGLLTVSTDKEKTKTAYFLLTDYVRKGNPKSKNRIFVVHRLDKDISGVLLFAKNEKSRQYLLDNWQQFSKKYSAVVHGKLTKKEGIITSYLAENSIHKMYSVQNPEKGVLAETGYKVIKESSKYSLLEINLLTSRKNQIRAHFSEKSCPIAGDKKYGEKQKGIKRLTLHAQAITFTHPYTKKMMTVEAKIPGYFYSLLSRE